MIRLSFEILKKYEMTHFSNLKGEVSKFIDKLPEPYKVECTNEDNCECKANKPVKEWEYENLSSQCKFVFDLLNNPFESDFPFLKDYFLTTRFIIDSTQYVSSKDITSDVESAFLELLQNYLQSDAARDKSPTANKINAIKNCYS